MALVYLATNTVNGKLYVGKTKTTLARRWYDHIAQATRGRGFAFHAAIRKYGPAAFVLRILEEYATEEEALAGERTWVAKLGAFGPGGYNMCEGGRGAIGHVHSDDSLEKMREVAKAKQRVPSPLCRQRSAEVRAQGLSDDAKVRMGEAQRRRRAETPVTDEFREKMRRVRLAEAEANGGKQKPRALSATRSASLAASWESRPQRVTPFCIACGVRQTKRNSRQLTRRRSGFQPRCRKCETAKK